MGACECVRHGESHAKQDPARHGTLRETGGGGTCEAGSA